MDGRLNKKILFILIGTIFLIALLSIKVYAADEFTLTEKNIDVVLNGSKNISYTGGSGNITWNMEDTSIATVENGLITAKKIGTTTLTATRGSETASCTVNVVYQSLTIGGNGGKSVSKVNLILGEHDSEKMFASVEDGKLTQITDANIKWASNDDSIVTVESRNRSN